jgi:hypothetical protein
MPPRSQSRGLRSQCCRAGACAALLFWASSVGAASGAGGLFVEGVFGLGTDGGIEDLPKFNYGLEDSYFLAGGVGKRLANFRGLVDLEAEAQAVKHFAKQTHWEFDVSLALRWLPFPWDDVLDTSFAIGDGISYATRIPEIEAERNDKTARLLNYLMVELAFAPPSQPNWSVFLRVHHRSGVHGLFNGVSGGSNFLALGVRYGF